jgi:hypothetical protein
MLGGFNQPGAGANADDLTLGWSVIVVPRNEIAVG